MPCKGPLHLSFYCPTWFSSGTSGSTRDANSATSFSVAPYPIGHSIHGLSLQDTWEDFPATPYLPFCIISDSSLTSLRRRLLPSWRRSLYRPCRILCISGLAFSPLRWMAFEDKEPHVVHVLGQELHYVCYLVLPLRDTAECRWFTWLVKLLLPIRYHCKNHCITI